MKRNTTKKDLSNKTYSDENKNRTGKADIRGDERNFKTANGGEKNVNVNKLPRNNKGNFIGLFKNTTKKIDVYSDEQAKQNKISKFNSILNAVGKLDTQLQRRKATPRDKTYYNTEILEPLLNLIEANHEVEESY